MATAGARAAREDDQETGDESSPATARAGKRGHAAHRGGDDEEVDLHALPEARRVHRGRIECGRFNGREWVALC